MSSISIKPFFLPVGRIVCLAMLLLFAGMREQVWAADFQMGDVQATLDTTFKASAAIRASDQECSFISSFNAQGCDASGDSDNLDDGDLNYEQWDLVTARTEATTELEVEYQNFGGFARASFYFDALNSDRESTRRTDLSDTARRFAGRGVKLLDAYVFADFYLGNMPAQVRVGNQVVNWGESSFITGGVNSYNAFDISKLRSAGSPLKEALQPLPMVRASVDPIQDLELQAFYFLEWEETFLDPVGTFFSTEDVQGPGREGIFFGPDVPGAVGDPGASGLPAATILALGGGVPLLHDRTPGNSGQFGVSARYFVEDLDTELGLYYVRYHQRLPIRGATATCDALPVLIGGDPACTPTGYFREFAADQSLYGASARFVLGDASVGFEANYQPDFAVPRDGIITAALTTAALDSVALALGTGFAQTVASADMSGILRTNRYQAQVNATQTFGPSDGLLGSAISLAGMDDLTVAGEVGLTAFSSVPTGALGDRLSWGYVIGVQGAYTRVFDMPVSLYPFLNFSHGVKGTVPDKDIIDSFREDRKAISLGVAATYESEWVITTEYTNKFSPGNRYRSDDRDFIRLGITRTF